MPNYDFLLEHRLKELDRELAYRHTCCMSLFEQMLKKFLGVFPTFTDHTLLHTLSVTNITNQLLREEVKKLSASEIYINLMACALHDIGMGVSDRDLEQFMDSVGIREYVTNHPEMTKPTLIRRFHNEFSYAFVKKYWEIFEIPNEQYANAIAEVGRGHRKTDLFDEGFYPTDYELGDGNRANLAMLAAVLRIADELDVTSDRNPDLLYHIESMENLSERDVFEFSKHEAIHTVEFAEDTVVIFADTDKPDIGEGIITAARTIRQTLEYCVSVIEKRSDLCMGCKRVKLILNNKEVEV